MQSTKFTQGVIDTQTAPTTGALLPWSITLTPALYLVSTLTILGGGFIVRIWDLVSTDMWTDEMLTARRVWGPMENGLQSLFDVGNQAPLYYLVMRVLPNDNPLLLRFPSVMFGLFGIALTMYLMLKLYENRWLALWAGAMVATNPMLVVLSRTARYYTILYVLGLLVTYCFLLMLRGQDSRRMRGLFWFCSVAGFLTHYSALAMPAIQFLILALTWPRYRRIAWKWFVIQATAVLPFLIWLGIMFTSREPGKHPYLMQIPTAREIPITLLNLIVGYDGSYTWYALPGIVVAGIGLIAGTYHLLRTRKPEVEYLYWLLLAFLPVIVLFLMGITMGVQYRDRYLIVSIPAFLFIFMNGWDIQTRRLAALVLLFTSFVLMLLLFYNHDYERTNWHSAGRYMAKQLRPGDVLVFERDIFYEAFSYHYTGNPEVLANHVILDETPDTTAIEQQANRLWAVYRIRHEDYHRQGWATGLDPFDPELSRLNAWLWERRDRVIFQREFKGGILFLLSGSPQDAPSG